MATETQKPIADLNPSVENPSEVTNPPKPSSVSGDDDSKIAAPIEPTTVVEKKIKRAERFGISVQLTEQEKRNSRAERFGSASGKVSASSSVPGTEVSKNAEDLKRKARAERFGITSSSPTPTPTPTTTPTVTSDEDAKKKARLARFAPTSKTDPQEDEKKKARALRFASTQSKPASEANGNVKPVTNVAIAGKAGGGD